MKSIEDILAALQAIIESATEGDDPRPLTDDEINRYEELEKELAMVRSSEEVIKRNKAYGMPNRGPVKEMVFTPESREDVAFGLYLRTGVGSDDLEFRAQSGGVGSAGGFLVPEGFRAKIIDRLMKIGGLSAEVEHISTSSGNPLPWPTLDDTANEGDIVAEGAAAVAGADLVFGTKTLGAYKYESVGTGGLPLKVSWELAQDSAFDLEGLISQNLGARIGRKQSKHWATGTAVNQPQGILVGGTAAITIAVNANGPTLQNIIAMTHTIDPEYRESGESIWVMHDSILAGLEGMLDSNGRPLLGTSVDSIAGKPVQTIRGFRVVVDNTFPATWAGGANTIVFGNVKRGYVIRDVKEVVLIVLRELYSLTGQIGYLAWSRADGLVQDANAFKIMKAL